MRTLILAVTIGGLMSASALALTMNENDTRNTKKKIENTAHVSSVTPSADEGDVRAVINSAVLGDEDKDLAKIDTMFLEADIDSDGFLTEQEYIDYKAKKARASFIAMAGDDNLVEKSELIAQLKTSTSAREQDSE